jgi:hypothetical protein
VRPYLTYPPLNQPACAPCGLLPNPSLSTDARDADFFSPNLCQYYVNDAVSLSLVHAASQGRQGQGHGAPHEVEQACRRSPGPKEVKQDAESDRAYKLQAALRFAALFNALCGLFGRCPVAFTRAVVLGVGRHALSMHAHLRHEAVYSRSCGRDDEKARREDVKTTTREVRGEHESASASAQAKVLRT